MLWDDNFSREGATIIAARQRAVLTLSESAAVMHHELSGSAAENLALTYEPALGDEWSRMLPAGRDGGSGAVALRGGAGGAATA